MGEGVGFIMCVIMFYLGGWNMCSYEYGLLSMMRGRLRRNQRIGRRRELGRGSGSFRCWISHALLSSVPVSGKVTEHKTRLYKISEFCTTGIFDGNTYPIHSSGLKKDGFKIGLVFQVKKRTVEKKKDGGERQRVRKCWRVGDEEESCERTNGHHRCTWPQSLLPRCMMIFEYPQKNCH